ncbi:MAG: Ig-like domain repeat protein, partial [Myxococcota bacterium]
PRGSQSATTGLAVDMPSSIPEVTSVGGTRFVGDVANAATYWSPTNNASNGSALQYIPEAGWNDTAINIALFGGGLSASGGGESGYFSKPSWQTGVGVPADGRRDVPDIALNASALHDPYLICSQGSCVNGYRNVDLTLTVVGGTSAGAPTFAGILALINQGTGSSGLGNVNPKLYALAASTPAAFHDITTGSNIVPCSQGSTHCPVLAPFELGYSAGVGYDQVTGLGSVDAFALADGWAAKVATQTLLAASSSAVAPGANATFTATVSALAPGTGSPAGGRVQFAVDGSAAGTPVTVARTGSTYTASYTTNALAGGMRSVAASYLGNLTHLASSSTAISVNVADFSVSADPPSLVLSPGGTGTSILTVTTADGFAGTVSLACAVPAGATGVSCSASPSAVTLGVGVPTQTATLTITTTAAQTSAAPASRDFVLAAVLLLGLPTRRGRRALVHALAVIALAGASLSCGGGGGGGGGRAAVSSATPVGNYALTVDATSGSIAHALPISLGVQ